MNRSWGDGSVTGQGNSEYLTIVEAARVYRFSVRTITRSGEENRIPCVITSGEALVARRDLEAIVARPTASDPEAHETDS